MSTITPTAARHLDIAAALADELSKAVTRLRHMEPEPTFAGRKIRHANIGDALDDVQHAEAIAGTLVQALYVALQANFGPAEVAEATGVSRQAVHQWSTQYRRQVSEAVYLYDALAPFAEDYRDATDHVHDDELRDR